MRQCVARELLHIGDAIAYIRLHRAVRYVLESVRTRLLVRQRRAHPRLHVAHLEPERSLARSRRSDLPHLLQRAADFVHRVAEVAEAVAQRGGGARVRAVVRLAREVRDVGGHPVRVEEAHGDGDAGELAGVLLDGIGVGGEGGVADVRVESGAAALCEGEGGFK
ncbi:Hsp70-Hsp90 organizing protein like [Senna tora]|uniref:Hsp70-Hsp90 organizing protein like n=1 Tax=Senna tora TaxID=362788 RepID=A0A834STK9_9FABA|nr:Hsp70-Hsp90 organizing protein like [Senna tora]